jgi:hypothetical protein
MVEKQITSQVLHLLSIGSIQPFQVENYLRLSAVPEFRINKLVKEINEEHQRKHPCY